MDDDDTNDNTSEIWWKQQLSGLVLVNLPVITQDLCLKSKHECLKKNLNLELTSKVDRFIDNQNILPIVFFDTAYRVLFYRYTQQTDITWLVTYFSAKHKQIKSQVTRVISDGSSNFEQLCQQVQSFYNQSFQYGGELSSSAVEQLAKSVEPKALNMRLIQLSSNNDKENCESNVHLVEGSEDTGDYDLVIKVDFAKNKCATIEYCFKDGLFNRTTINRLSNHFTNLVTSMVNNSNCKLDVHELLDLKEVSLLQRFNPEFPVSAGQTFFMQMFYQSVDANCNFIAIKEQLDEINYNQLNKKSNQMANFFINKHNVKRGDMIAIMLPQGINNFISMLAVLKIGAAFVPLGIDYPGDRIKYILVDCDLPLLITESYLINNASINYEKTLSFKDIEKKLQFEDDNNLPITFSLDDLAYCMYTSGSTGQPKGVLISQRTISYMATSLTQIFSVDRHTRSSLISNTAFDAAICESFPTLTRGGLLILPDPEKRYNHDYLIDWLVEEGINYCYLPAKILDLIFESNLHLKIKHPIKIWASGEPLGPVKLSKTSVIEVYNVLGMTELTPLTYILVNSLSEIQDHYKPPVGKPVPGVKVYICDSYGRLCPIGVVGEIYYSSPLIALGYHKLPEQTKAKFLTDIFNNQVEESRCLKSGDLARWRDDGLIDFIGRADDQVKVRGYRIELKEIENLLNNFKGIHQSIVLVKKNRINDPKIVAYLMLKENNQQHATSWRKDFSSSLHQHLRAHLPYFMLPQVFVVPEFPLNSNGKVDKGALLAYDDCEPLMSSMFHQPLTKSHYDMIKVWSAVLSIPSETLGIDDHFFELGGHSLLAATIVAQLNQSPYNYPITTRMMLTLGTIRAICDAFDHDSMTNENHQMIPILETRSGIDLSSAQSWVSIFELGCNGSGVTNEFSYFLIPNGLQISQVNDAINCLIDRHEALRIVLNKSKHNKIRQSAVPFKPIDIPITSCSTMDEAIIYSRNLLSSISNIFNGRPLVKFSFIQLPCEQLIVMAANHLIMDGVSYQILLQEFNILFDAIKSDVPVNLPELKIGLLDYVDWETRIFFRDNNLIDKAAKFWLQRLKGFTIPRLPLIRDPILCVGDEADLFYIWFDIDVTQKIDLILKEYRTTLFVFTQTIILAVLHLYTGLTDITIYQAARSINHHWALSLVGHLAVINFSRVQWSGDIKFVDFLRLTHSCVMKEHEFRYYSFQKLFASSASAVGDDNSDNNDDDDNELGKLIPITLAQGCDRNEPLEFMKGTHTPSHTMNALVIHFMKVEKRYTIEFKYSKHGLEHGEITRFIQSVEYFVKQVTANQTLNLSQYADFPITSKPKW